jgi:hypothetical protein
VQLVAHQILSGALTEHIANWSLSVFLSARPLKFIGLSGAPPDCPVRQWSNRQIRQRSTAEQSDRQKSQDSLRCQIAADCPMPREDRILQWSIAPNPNGRLTWHSPDSEQCSVRCTTGLAGVPIDSNGWNSGWSYKYPPTTTIQAIQALQLPHSILEQKNRLKDTIKASNPLQVPKIKLSAQKYLVT